MDAKEHARWAGGLHLALTQCLAVAYAGHTYASYENVSLTPAGDAMKDWMLMSTLVGSTLALFRSTRTNSTALQGQATTDELRRRVEDLHDELEGLRRERGDELEVLRHSYSVYRASRLDEGIQLLKRLVEFAVRLPDTDRAVDALSLWVFHAGSWRMLVAAGISDKSAALFVQPGLMGPTDGGGLVANMHAAKQSRLIIARGVQNHRWFMRDPNSLRTTEGFAGSLLWNREGAPFGAICLTSEQPDAVPGEHDERPGHLDDVLTTWSVAFTLALEGYVRLTEQR